MLTRRDTLICGLALSASSQAAALSIAPPLSDRREFAVIERRIGGRVGVAALNTATGAWMTQRLAARFAMCSTFKWLLAAQMLAMDTQAPGLLAQQMRVSESDLLEYAPAARQHIARGSMSVEEACAGAVILSDNTCANLLLARAGGPEGFTRFLRANGDGVTRLGRIEPDLNMVALGDERDTTTPYAMVLALQRFLLTDIVLNAAARERLIGWMIESPTGRERLRAGLPPDWRVGDKTGTWTGEHNATNDVAIAWPPGRAPILIAVYLSASTAPFAERNAAHAEIARIVAEEWG